GNVAIDNFIKHASRMEFVPFEKFKDIEYNILPKEDLKATWINGPITNRNYAKQHKGEMTVTLKELTYSKDITFNQLNEIK
ncbi:2239_t:CDS:1, partial [Rhizophagus irregularis]